VNRVQSGYLRKIDISPVKHARLRDAAAPALPVDTALFQKKEQTGMSTPRVEIIEEYCKGCSICVEFCPTQVFEMEGFVAKVVRPEACIKCMQCELRCPDFAVKVYEEDEE
jgi:2-oxoglutarate ferredoxin oxidoreductase subunit delta